MSLRTGIYTVLLVAFVSGSLLAAPVIGNLSDNTSSYRNSCVPRYEKYELTFTITGVGTAFTDYNPFNPNVTALGSQYYNKRGILVDGILTAPNGSVITHPAFWFDNGVWKLRYSPTMGGRWKVRIKARDANGTTQTVERSFFCDANTTNRGFVRLNPADHRFMQFLNGRPLYPIGCSISGYTSTSGSTQSAWEIAFPKMRNAGANFTRVFFTSLNIEPYCVGSNKASPRALNNYDLSRARKIDQIFDLARKYDIYVEFLLDDWTYLKDTSNQYIRTSGRDAPCDDVEEFFTSSAAKEIYKRKLRYWIARWGYSTHLAVFEFINELGGGGSGTSSWHVEMGQYIKSFKFQPHLVSSSNGSGELRTGGGIPWNDPAMNIVNYHDYAKYTQGWNIKASYPVEALGSTLQYPWMDTAVWADRIARMHFKRYRWNRPLIWSEYGLIFRRPGDSGFPDWDLAYEKDTTALHVKDATWAGMLSGMGITHWKLNYMLGRYGGGEKFYIFRPLANYLNGEIFAGLTQETTYPVADPLNPSPRVTSSNGKVMVVSMYNPTRAYMFVKNLTDTWFRYYYNSQSSDRYADSSKIPKHSVQSTTIRVRGMTPGTYRVETWSVNQTDRSKAILAVKNITVGSDGVATVVVNNIHFSVAFKIKRVAATRTAQSVDVQTGSLEPADEFEPVQVGKPNIILSVTADMDQAVPGQTVTYFVSFSNTGDGATTDVGISVPLPKDTIFVAASEGGKYDADAGTITWIVPNVEIGGKGLFSFQVRIK